MSEDLQVECLFIGGSADGERKLVDASQDEVRLPSLSRTPALHDPVARSLDDDPVPDESVVVEVYRKVLVEQPDGEAVVYALNGLSEDAVTGQLVKHFGPDEAAPLL